MPVTIEDVGVCKKKLVFEIPQEEIAAKREATLDELSDEAQIPGFRPGHAPKRLVYRKLRDEIDERVKSELVAETYQKAVEENELEVLREEEFDIESLKLPEEGSLEFEVEVEVKPEVELPEIDGAEIEAEAVAVSDEDVEQATENLRRSRGQYAEQPAETETAERDMLSCDVRIEADGQVLHEAEDATLAVFPQAVGGIRIDNLADELAGHKVGDEVGFQVTLPDDYENEGLRGKQADVTVKIKEVRRMEMPPLDEEFAGSVGFGSVEELTGQIRERLESDAAEQRENNRRIAVGNWLLDQVDLEVPQGVAEANADRVFNQQVLDLQRRGVPVEFIQERADELRKASHERGQRELKLEFILEAVAKAESIEVSEDELQARVAMIASNYNRTPDRVYDELEKAGRLGGLRDQIRDDKVFARLLDKVNITEVEPKPESQEAEAGGETKAADKADDAPADETDGDKADGDNAGDADK